MFMVSVFKLLITTVDTHKNHFLCHKEKRSFTSFLLKNLIAWLLHTKCLFVIWC